MSASKAAERGVATRRVASLARDAATALLATIDGLEELADAFIGLRGGEARALLLRVGELDEDLLRALERAQAIARDARTLSEQAACDS